MADHNRYSVDARAAGRMVLVRSHAERIVVLLDDEVVADHPRQIPARPDHLRSLALSAGSGEEARRFAQWRAVQGLGSAARLGPGPRQAEAAMPMAIVSSSRCWARCSIMGLAAVEAACAEALAAGIASGDVILTVLARQRQPAAPPSITTPDALRLKIEPVADCGRYDSIRKVA